MEANRKRFLSANELTKQYGIPNNMIRKDIKSGFAPGFYSNSWFYIDVPTYLDMICKRREEPKDDKD